MPAPSRYFSLLTATRPHNSLACGLLLGAGLWPAWPQPGWQLPVAALAVGLLCAAAHLVNDLVDLPADRWNRPARPLPAGRLSVGLARQGAALLVASGVVLGLATGVLHWAWWVFWAGSGLGYSLAAKGHPWRAPLWTALVIASCWLAGAHADGFTIGEAAAGLTVFWFVFLREIIKQIEDARGDLLGGYQTCAGHFPGTRAGLLLLAAPLLGAGVYLLARGGSPIPLAATVLFLVCLVVAVIFILNGRPRGLPSAGSLLKVGAFMGVALLLHQPWH